MWSANKNFVGACVCALVYAVAVTLSVLLLVYFSSIVDYAITSVSGCCWNNKSSSSRQLRIFSACIVKKSTIVPGHASYEQLQNPSLPIYKDVYFYNLTNPQDLAAGGKPCLQQVGPYSFRLAINSEKMYARLALQNNQKFYLLMLAENPV